LLAAILFVSLAFQVFDIRKVESGPDDCRIVESALLITEGYHPFFGLGYAMTPTWIWSAALHARWLVEDFRKITPIFAGQKVKNLFGLFSQYRASIFNDPQKTHLPLRIINCIFTLTLCFMAYMIAVRLFESRAAGLIACAICAVSPMIVYYGQNFHPDQFQALFAMLCIYFCLGEAYRESDNQWVYASIFLGAAVATKFIAGVFVLPLTTGLILGGRQRGLKSTLVRILAAFAIISASYLIINPYIFTNFDYVLKFVFITVEKFYTGSLPDKGGSGFILMSQALSAAVGVGVIVLSLIGALSGLFRRPIGTSVMLVAVLSYGLLLSSSSNIERRYILSMLPMVAVFAGFAIVLAARRSPGGISIILATILLAVALAKTGKSLEILERRANGDTRTDAKIWLEKNVPEGSRVYVTYGGPVLNYSRNSIKCMKSFYADRLFITRDTAFPSEFFRDAVLREEMFFFKKFEYLDELDRPLSPSYDLVELIYMPNDPTLMSMEDKFWLVITVKEWRSALNPGLTTKAIRIARKKGRRAAFISNKGKVGRNILIFEIDMR